MKKLLLFALPLFVFSCKSSVDNSAVGTDWNAVDSTVMALEGQLATMAADTTADSTAQAGYAALGASIAEFKAMWSASAAAKDSVVAGTLTDEARVAAIKQLISDAQAKAAEWQGALAPAAAPAEGGEAAPAEGQQ
ncbi:MAG: hypothetical protein LW630_04750 [Saprospiraceae bacterium]|jgi:hypothetical protein|nr:hypothetical protein [Saprospiraceae bacterium]